MNQDDQINQLNSIVKLKVKPSPIGGVGVFALTKLNKGQKLYASMFPKAFKISPGNLDKLFPEVKEIILEQNCSASIGDPFMWPVCNYQAFMNHSNTPNYDCILDIALEDIEAGQELFEDYRVIPGYENVYKFIK